jgi:sortase (surface protein transpeptidase)
VTQPPNVAAANQAAQASEAQKKAAAIGIPAFAGHTLADPVGGVVALVGIVLVMSLAAWITAGGNLSGGGQWSPGALGALTPRRIGSLALLWGGVGLAGLGLVLFQLGPLLAQREQRSLLSEYKKEVSHAAYSTQSLTGAAEEQTAPAHGDPVGVLEIGALKVQNVVVEGVTPSQTRDGPGHVPGTSGLGQPGNSVVVGRRNGYGGVFAGLDLLRKGDRIVVTTTQGQSVYAVQCVNRETIEEPSDDSSSTSGIGSSSSSSKTSSNACSGSKAGSDDVAPVPGAATTTTTAPAGTTTTGSNETTTTAPGSTTTTASGTSTTTTTTKSGASAAARQPTSDTALAAATHRAQPKTPRRSFTTTIDQLYGPSSGDQLTLVTSAEKSPFNTGAATVVVAKLMSEPFPPTNQNGRNDAEIGRGSDPGALAAVVLSLMAFVAVIAASVALYRKMRFRIAYVLTIAPLVALTIVTGEALARLLPAWT